MSGHLVVQRHRADVQQVGRADAGPGPLPIEDDHLVGVLGARRGSEEHVRLLVVAVHHGGQLGAARRAVERGAQPMGHVLAHGLQPRPERARLLTRKVPGTRFSRRVSFRFRRAPRSECPPRHGSAASKASRKAAIVAGSFSSARCVPCVHAPAVSSGSPPPPTAVGKKAAWKRASQRSTARVRGPGGITKCCSQSSAAAMASCRMLKLPAASSMRSGRGTRTPRARSAAALALRNAHSLA